MSGGAKGRGEPLFEPGDLVSVLGLGVSGIAAARLARSRGARVYASDRGAGAALREAAERLGEEGIEAEAGRHDLDRILHSRVVVASPGIDPRSEIRAAIDEAGIMTVAEVELASRYLRSRLIGVTGTNGKTTTTALCGHLLSTAGRDAVTAGNIGRPLSDVAMAEIQPEWVVVELSSFQLADLVSFNPAIGVLLNLAPDHLDRYASVESYYEDKGRLFANADETSRWVLNADDPGVVELARRVPGRRYWASAVPHDEPGAWIDEQGWLVARTDEAIERWLRVDELRLLGAHNAMNALLGGLAAALAGCTAAEVGEGLASFEPLPHRLAPVAEAGGVLWVNDSKATNVSATRVALSSFERPLVLILGGRHKGETYASLLPGLEQRARAVIVYGESAPLIVRDLGDKVPLELAGSLEDVVRQAAEIARAGDVVLFSPACSSYDMFPGYEERGRAFEHLVRARTHGGEA